MVKNLAFRRIHLLFIPLCILCIPGILFSQQVLPTGFVTSLDSILNIPVNSASRYWQKASDAPASVSIITAEEIERFGYETLGEALQSVRGMYISNDRNYSYVGVRGFSRPTDYNDRIILLLNGHRMNENVYGSCYVGNDLGLNLESVEQIEIVRGPGSSLYGTGAMLAVINIITKRAIKAEQVSVGAGAGSFGKFTGSAMYERNFENDLDINVSGTWGDIRGQDLYYKEYDAPATNSGIARRLDWEKYTGVLATATYKELSFQGLVSSRSKGIPTGAYGVVFNDSRTKTLDAMINTALTYEHDVDDNKNLIIRGSYLRYTYKGEYPYETETNSDEIVGEQLMLGGQLLWDMSSEYRVIAGCDGIYSPTASYVSASATSTYFDKNVSSSIVSPYIHNEYQVTDIVKVIAGLRSDIYSEGGAHLAPRFAAIITPWTTTSIKMLYGEAFRTPNVAEMNYEDSLSGFKKSIGLKPEQIATIEGILEQRLGDEYFTTLSVYRYAMNNLIDTKQDFTDSMFRYENISAAIANGFEVGMQMRYQYGFAAYAHYCYQRTIDKATNAMLTNSPEHIIKAGMAVPIVEGMTASTDWMYESQRITVYNTATHAYLTGNATLTMRSIVPGLDGTVRVRNILDRNYRLPGGVEHVQPSIAQDGRSFGVSVRYSF